MTLSACFKMPLRPVHALILFWDGHLCSGKNNTVWASFAKCVVVLKQPDSRSPVSTCFRWVFTLFLVAVLSQQQGGKPESLKLRIARFWKAISVDWRNFFSRIFKISQSRNRWCDLSLTLVTPSCPTPCNGCVASLLTNYIRRLSAANNLYQTITFLLLFVVEFWK